MRPCGEIGLFALLLALAPTGLEAQEQASPPDLPGGWILTLGLARQGISDELVSPLRYRGTGVLAGVGYQSVDPGRVRRPRVRHEDRGLR